MHPKTLFPSLLHFLPNRNFASLGRPRRFRESEEESGTPRQNFSIRHSSAAFRRSRNRAHSLTRCTLSVVPSPWRFPNQVHAAMPDFAGIAAVAAAATAFTTRIALHVLCKPLKN